MKNQLDVTKALNTFNTITKLGEKTDSGYFYEGIYAQTDFDGYTVMLTDKTTQLSIFFHNKYQIDGPDNAALERFTKKLDYIAKTSN